MLYMENHCNNLIYIMSPSYSGSTLLTFLMAMHPDIATVGELKATSMGDIDDYICSCGLKIKSCDFWEKVTHYMNGYNRKFSLNDFGTHFASDNYLYNRLLRAGVRGGVFDFARRVALISLPGWRRTYLNILEQNRYLIDAITSIQGAKVFLDDSKDPVRVKYFIESGRWNIKILYLIRDGRGVTNSYMRHNNADMLQAATQWISKIREMDKVINGLDSNAFMKVKYEDLCSDPEAVLKEIFSFACLDANSVASDFKAVKHHILGNSMRLGSSGEVRLDEKWKTALTQTDLDVFSRMAENINTRLGYI